MMLIVAFKDCDLGIGVQFRTDGSVWRETITGKD